MLQINGKTFMNLQEAVQWLLDNNALPFQSSANYVANTEIGMGTIVNPSPAKVRIGSLIFFADSKVSTVIGLTENGFICSDQYNNLVDDIAYVTNVAINASGHLITTLSDGQTIDAGIVKQVSSFSINGSQHLIVNYNDGTSADLGAIFNGNVNIAGNFTANSIIENMVGYSATVLTPANLTISTVYAGIVKNGNKITLVWFGTITPLSIDSQIKNIIQFNIPLDVGNKIYPYSLGAFDNLADTKIVDGFTDLAVSTSINAYLRKSTSSTLVLQIRDTNLTANMTYLIRYEATFLLSDNLAS